MTLRERCIETLVRSIFQLPADVEPSAYMLGRGGETLNRLLSVLADHADEWTDEAHTMASAIPVGDVDRGGRMTDFCRGCGEEPS